MADSKKENNLTIEALIFEKSQLERRIIELEAQLELMKELFKDYYSRYN